MIAAVALPHTVQGLRRWSEHLDGDGVVNFYSANNWQYFRILPKICIFADEKNSYGKNDTE
jgi:hypothetical protein